MPTGSERVVESSMGTCCAFEVIDAHSLPHISAVGTAVENLHLKPNSGSLREVYGIQCMWQTTAFSENLKIRTSLNKTVYCLLCLNTYLF